jgi:hypothetical protein
MLVSWSSGSHVQLQGPMVCARMVSEWCYNVVARHELQPGRPVLIVGPATGGSGRRWQGTESIQPKKLQGSW